MKPCDFHRQCLGPQPITATGPTGAVILIPLHLFAAPRRIRLAVPPLHVRDDPLKHAGHLINPPAFVVTELDLFLARPLQEQGLHRIR